MAADTLVVPTLQTILNSSSDIASIFITDMKGIQVAAVGEDHRNKTQMYNAFKVSVDQSDKIGIGRQKCAVYGYSSSQIVMISMEHLIVFIVARANANTGMLMEMRTQLQPVAEALLNAIPSLRDVQMDD
ncbi:hypothetical protein QR680_004671 [Steinernema hermaphroditum]|uniref:Uncharacterized protein n=1 Tax=Steinernema hermaphroditum TaxID=289476 RepID=A0AA39HPF4_9BILA|nr:hypothetical protein QR680_004670 [Steinernema hermaphroditum]KAK0409643.1 hypothetical protein QR680_004671 [Steinernema hermaphroditum]